MDRIIFITTRDQKCYFYDLLNAIVLYSCVAIGTLCIVQVNIGIFPHGLPLLKYWCWTSSFHTTMLLSESKTHPYLRGMLMIVLVSSAMVVPVGSVCKSIQYSWGKNDPPSLNEPLVITNNCRRPSISSINNEPSYLLQKAKRLKVLRKDLKIWK